VLPPGVWEPELEQQLWLPSVDALVTVVSSVCPAHKFLPENQKSQAHAPRDRVLTMVVSLVANPKRRKRCHQLILDFLAHQLNLSIEAKAVLGLQQKHQIFVPQTLMWV
jgi:hypothetical protein